MSKSLHDQAAQHSAQSREELQEELFARFSLNDPLLKLIARAITDAKIEGTLAGMHLVSDNIQLEAYARGYTDGRSDAQ
jgi:hypothetical protein